MNNQEEFVKAGTELINNQQDLYDRWFNTLNRKQKRRVTPSSSKYSNLVKKLLL